MHGVALEQLCKRYGKGIAVSDVLACLGGWCHVRDYCPHYHAKDRRAPNERLCLPGQDGVSDVVPIRLHRPAGTWERLPSQYSPAAAQKELRK